MAESARIWLFSARVGFGTAQLNEKVDKRHRHINLSVFEIDPVAQMSFGVVGSLLHTHQRPAQVLVFGKRWTISRSCASID